MKRVFISGILGMDGSTLAEYILDNTDNQVYGLMRRSSNPNLQNIEKIRSNPRLNLVYGDIGDRASLMDLVGNIQPHFFINFAGFTFTEPSWECPAAVMDVNFGGVLNALEAIRKLAPNCRLFQAGSSEVFGTTDFSPQNEKTKHNPRNFYGISKSAAAHAVRLYREKYGMFCVNGYLYNHESFKRTEQYVFSKVCKGAAKIAFALKHHLQFSPIELGNLDCMRDWSDCYDIVSGIWQQVNYTAPVDLVFSSDQLHTVSEVIRESFKTLKIPIDSITFKLEDGRDTIKQDSKFYRAEMGVPLVGDSSLARSVLDWHPHSCFESLVSKICYFELRRLENSH